ncbi:Alanine racemase 1 [bioreactor metagenome]|uniref:Alanine racemase 1 n=1 Tax=bioreactor metagenome TaxID=1076179 RepID=A0A644WIP9_9ZZZZ
MKRLIIEQQAVRHNADVIKGKAGSAEIYAILTGDAYGAGLIEMADILRSVGIGRFAVSEPGDVAALRRKGFVEEEILMLRSTTDRAELEQLVDLNAVCTIGSYDTGVALNALAETRATAVEAHLQIDTGMGFGGFLADEPDKFLSMYRYLPNVAITGIYTQLHRSGRNRKSVAAQLQKFSSALESIRAAGFQTGVVHASGTDALLHRTEASLDAVMVGSAFVGRGDRKRDDGLTRVGYGEAFLEEIRWLPKGHTVGTYRQVMLRKPTRVAVIPVGSQNGLGIAWSRCGGFWDAIYRWWTERRMAVRIGGQRVRIIGRIGKMETVLDVTDIKCSAGDVAVFDLDPMYTRGMPFIYR